MHPIERLRYVARSTGADHASLVRETAGSLGGFRDDPGGMVMAYRRMLARHLTSGPLWWLASRACMASDPQREAWAAADELDADPTARQLLYALPEDATICVLGWPELLAEALVRRGDIEVLVVDAGGDGSSFVRRLERSDVEAIDVPPSGVGAAAAEAALVVLEASMVGPEHFVAPAGSRAAAAVARHAGVPVWLVIGVGRLLPQRLWEVIAERLDREDDPWERDEEIVPLSLVDQVVGPNGLESVADALRRCDTPVAPELFKEGVL
ncbi:MAG: hypothetical protein OEY23_23420 [Acidimicrobiia bacterium]|nr:hypothetical protein [Acidimicrobiia bacterium]